MLHDLPIPSSSLLALLDHYDRWRLVVYQGTFRYVTMHSLFSSKYSFFLALASRAWAACRAFISGVRTVLELLCAAKIDSTLVLTLSLCWSDLEVLSEGKTTVSLSSAREPCHTHATTTPQPRHRLCHSHATGYAAATGHDTASHAHHLSLKPVTCVCSVFMNHSFFNSLSFCLQYKLYELIAN